MVHKILGESQAGDQCGALVRGIKRDGIKRGMAMCKPGTMKAYDNFETQVYMLTKKESGRTKPLTNFTQLQMFSRTWDCTTQVQSQGKEMVVWRGYYTDLDTFKANGNGARYSVYIARW